MSGTKKNALEFRIDELCAVIERMRKTAAMLATARTNLLTENATLRQQLADATANTTRMDKLYAELGKTQLNLDMWYDRAEDMRNRLSAAQADKIKLLELCEDMLSYIQICATFNRSLTMETYETFYKRARELGMDE